MSDQIKPGDYVRVTVRSLALHPTWGLWVWHVNPGTILRISRIDEQGRLFYKCRLHPHNEDWVYGERVEKIDPPPSRRRRPATFVLSAILAVSLPCLWHGPAGGNPEGIVNAMQRFIEIAQQILENDTIRTAVERLLSGTCHVLVAAMALQLLKSGGHAVGRWRDYSRKASREKSDLKFNERREAEQREEAARERERSLIIAKRKAEAEADAIKIAAAVQHAISLMPTTAEATAFLQRGTLLTTLPTQPPQSAKDVMIRPGVIVEFIRDGTNGENVFDPAKNNYRPAVRGDRVTALATVEDSKFAYVSGMHRWTSDVANVKVIA